MLKGQRKVNSFGIASCVGLLALGLLAANPIAGNAVYAFDSAPDDGGTGNAGSNTDSSTITSSVNIAFTPESGSASLTPISADGASARYSIKATVGVENSGGYTVYLGSNKSELTGKNTGATINGVTSSSAYEELPLNSWGYNAIEGETAGTTFSKVPTNNRGDVIASNNSTNIKEDSKTFTLSFAAHIGNDKPADTYENEITLSVVSSPLEVTNAFGVRYMQDFVAGANGTCSEVEVGTTAQLIDKRDGKYYWVAKLVDNNCWMVQNLDLDLGTEWPDASLSDYDVASTAYKPVATTALSSETTDASAVGTHSWSLGDYVIVNPTATSSCGNGLSQLSSCSSRFVAVGNRSMSEEADFYANNGNKTYTATEYDAHYLVGNHYQWNTATAGTGGTMTGGQASGSICPKNWKLPVGGTGNGSYSYMISAGGISSNAVALTSAPYYYVRAGYIDGGNMLYAPGFYGRYWSSTASSNQKNAEHMNFYSTVLPTDSYFRYYGNSVRCVAR